MSKETPHLTLKRESSSWNGWCVHYAGLFDHMKPVTHCRAGVEYASVTKNTTFTYGYEREKYIHTSHQARPCFKREHGLTDGCSHCRFPTEEEIKKHEEDTIGMIKRMLSAREEIINELAKRHSSGDTSVKMNATAHPECEDGPENFISGDGIMTCPVCHVGKLRYSRAAYNGHIHAKCSTPDCVDWME